MKKKFKFLTLILSVLVIICSYSSTIVHATSNIDITTSSVRDDLESMDMDKLSYLSNTENLFITMSQYYDNENKLRSYLYINYIGDVNDINLYVELSTVVMDSDYNITEDYYIYELSFVNQEETWCKYEILNLPNLEKTTRRYHINSIGYYNYTSGANIYTYIINDIAQTFIYNGITNDVLKVFHQEVDIITITDKELVFYCYGQGDTLWFHETNLMQQGDIYTDSWYIFFNTDKEIEDLMEVELTYNQYDYHFSQTVKGILKTDAITIDVINEMKESVAYGDDFVNGRSYVNYHDPITFTIEPGTTKVSYIDKGWFGKYDIYYEELDNIMNLKEYQAQDSENFVFTDYANKYNWGVHFKDTTRHFEDYNSDLSLPIALNLEGSGMSDVAILRLKFKINGLIKNCYAVDSPSSDFTGESSSPDTKFEEMFEKILALIGLVLLIIFIGFLTPVINLVITLLKVILKTIISIITFPFKIFSRKKRL